MTLTLTPLPSLSIVVIYTMIEYTVISDKSDVPLLILKASQLWIKAHFLKVAKWVGGEGGDHKPA